MSGMEGETAVRLSPSAQRGRQSRNGRLFFFFILPIFPSLSLLSVVGRGRAPCASVSQTSTSLSFHWRDWQLWFCFCVGIAARLRESSPVDGTFVSTATWDTRSKNVFVRTWSRHSISTCSVYTEHYGNFRAQRQNKAELLLTALRFSFKFLGKFHVVSSSFHVWLAVYHPMMHLTQFQKILM